ncbi:Permease, cytosine/purines, uracil, thiamine, allantoin [Niveomyces insectorum RCEF 264]|uniref:Permease, cytosine/purines, uracil, thiamine, allantoin n=1 Tax=Niveomyces insectorum RCEF 264 TaxID=1081102 RepID=A0A167Q7W1_9HYPO|nr:Permease, cytosine/purines, uracil, thiamine, allantoin [Niveomyces insectorum RCEF 264]
MAVKQRVERVKQAFSSKEEFKKFVETKEQGRFFNEDLLPSGPEHRPWRTLHFFAYYLIMTFSPTSYNLGATLVSSGLAWWHCIIAAVIGSFILSVIVIFASRGAALYHVGFPAYVRASAGVTGSKLFIGVRASVATIYFATQSYYGGRITAVALRCIFGSAWTRIPNHLPESAGITSANLLAFFIFWLLQLPFTFVHPRTIRHLFVVKSVFSTAAFMGVLGWAVHKNHGSLGNFDFGTKQLHGSAVVWPMIGAINSVMGALCPILINQPDISRYAKRPSQGTWSQAIGILLSKVIVMFVSAGTTSACIGVVGKAYWNVWDLYDAILTQFWGPTARAGIFFASFGMVLAILATNVGSNSLPVGADITGMFPRYLNIVRGQVLCAIMAPLCVPWKIIASAATFLTFLGCYTVFLMPICGIMVLDFYVIRRGNIHVPSLYTLAEGTPYSYYKGWNIRAVVAWACGVAFVVHGVAGNLDPDSVNTASKNMYKLGFLLSFFMGMFLYYVFCQIWKPRLYPQWAIDRGLIDEPLKYEWLAPSEGFLPGENYDTIRGVLTSEHDFGRTGSSSEQRDIKEDYKEEVLTV